MALFDGVENFTPAFTGQQIAIQAGQGAGQSIYRGMQVAQKSNELKFEEKKWAATQPPPPPEDGSEDPTVSEFMRQIFGTYRGPR